MVIIRYNRRGSKKQADAISEMKEYARERNLIPYETIFEGRNIQMNCKVA